MRTTKSNPFVLEIFLTNRCNMACSYCSARDMLRETGARTLTLDELKRAVDLVSGNKDIEEEFKYRLFVFAGGEPLVEYELLKKAISYIRTKKGYYRIVVTTNGTLLTREKLDFFVANDVRVGISLDGYREVNDRYRKFKDGGKRSAFGAVMANLKPLLLEKKYRDSIYLQPVIGSENIHLLGDIMRFFKRDLGFKYPGPGLESYGLWSPREMGLLRTALRGFKAQLLARLTPEAGIETCGLIFREFPCDRCPSPGCAAILRQAVVLFYDGNLYPYDFVLTPSPDSKYIVGDLRRGVDFPKIRELCAEVFAAIHPKCEYTSGLLSPVERYYWAIVHKFTPAELDRLMRNTSDVNKVCCEELGSYLKMQKIYFRLTRRQPSDFAHPPKNRGSKEIKVFRPRLAKGAAFTGLRDGLDYFLYSPGADKTLLLDSAGGGDALEETVLYSLMKARHLKKRLRLAGEFRAGGIDGELLEYLREHGVLAGR